MKRIVFVTQYALTEGIQEREVNKFHTSECSHHCVYVDLPGGGLRGVMPVRKPHWHETRAEAEARANKMVAAKIASLKKQLAKLETLTF